MLLPVYNEEQTVTSGKRIPSMNEEIRVRRATEHDIEILTDLRVAFLSQIYEVQNPQALWKNTYQYMCEKVPSGGFVSWIAEVNGTVVGTSGLVFFDPPPSARLGTGREAYILNMYTLPEWRGRGIASRLLSALIQFARESGAWRIWLSATDEGKPVYEKHGFVTRGQGKQTEMELLLS
jgi:GNAT superfamily N-acetyltransferase